MLPGLIGLSLAARLPPAAAQDVFPSRPIHLVVPFVAGSSVDIVARLLAPVLEASLKIPLVVLNVPGAGGTIGVERVVHAPADGYTLVLSADAAVVLRDGAYGLRPNYDAVRDLTPIAQVAVTPNVLVVSNSVQARNLQELIALVRRQPGRFSYASAGIGTSQHRAGELLSSMAGLDMVHVPNPSTPLLDVASGRAQLMFANVTNALPAARQGLVRALAITSLTRSPSAPELPTVSESGLPGFEALAWFGVLAPAGTPAPVLRRLEAEIQKALAQPAVGARLAELGATPGVPDGSAFARVIQQDIQRWGSKH